MNDISSPHGQIQQIPAGTTAAACFVEAGWSAGIFITGVPPDYPAADEFEVDPTNYGGD
jgi:hypothetical protein